MKPPADRPDTLTSAGLAPSAGSGTAPVAACAAAMITAAAANPFHIAFLRIAGIAVSYWFMYRTLACRLTNRPRSATAGADAGWRFARRPSGAKRGRRLHARRGFRG